MVSPEPLAALSTPPFIWYRPLPLVPEEMPTDMLLRRCHRGAGGLGERGVPAVTDVEVEDVGGTAGEVIQTIAAGA